MSPTASLRAGVPHRRFPEATGRRCVRSPSAPASRPGRDPKRWARPRTRPPYPITARPAPDLEDSRGDSELRRWHHQLHRRRTGRGDVEEPHRARLRPVGRAGAVRGPAGRLDLALRRGAAARRRLCGVQGQHAQPEGARQARDRRDPERRPELRRLRQADRHRQAPGHGADHAHRGDRRGGARRALRHLVRQPDRRRRRRRLPGHRLELEPGPQDRARPEDGRGGGPPRHPARPAAVGGEPLRQRRGPRDRPPTRAT